MKRRAYFEVLIKLGGTLLDDPESRGRLARKITAVAAREQVAVIQASTAGKQMTRYLAERSIKTAVC